MSDCFTYIALVNAVWHHVLHIFPSFQNFMSTELLKACCEGWRDTEALSSDGDAASTPVSGWCVRESLCALGLSSASFPSTTLHLETPILSPSQEMIFDPGWNYGMLLNTDLHHILHTHHILPPLSSALLQITTNSLWSRVHFTHSVKSDPHPGPHREGPGEQRCATSCSLRMMGPESEVTKPH